MTQAGSPDPRNDRICITSSCPRQFVEPSIRRVAYTAAGSSFGSLNRSPRTIMAQAIRAILLASATAATLIGRRSMMRASQSRFVPCCRAYRMTAIAPVTSSHRKYRLPCFEIPPSRSLPPVECCLGTKPDPGRQVASGRERFPITHLGDQGGGDDRANARDFLKPPTFFTRSVPGMDVLLNGSDLCRGICVLPSKSVEAQSRNRWNAVIIHIRNDLQQLGRAIAALGRDDAELGQVPADRIR